MPSLAPVMMQQARLAVRDPCANPCARGPALSARRRGSLERSALGIELEDLALVGVTALGLLGEEQFAVDLDVEDAARRGDHRQFVDDVLVVVQQILNRAHGTG